MSTPQHRIPPTGAATGILALALLVAPVACASSATATTAPAAPTGASPEAGYPIENYIHPNAEAIAARTGIVLKEGDGHLMFADCTSTREQIQVTRSSPANRTVCFTLTGSAGWLTMEIPGSYGVRAGKNFGVTVTTNDNGHKQTHTVAKGARHDVTNAIGDDVVLVELRVK